MMEEIFQGADDQWYYRVKGSNGETLVVSEGYVSEYNAERGLETLKKQWDKEYEDD